MANWDEITGELFTLPPDRFTRARDTHAAQARKEGDRDLADRIRTLHRPTTAAFALNLFARREPEQVQQLLSLGQRLREAQDSWSGPRLRELSAQRARVVTDLAAVAAALAAEAGQQLSAGARAEVEQSLRAILADPGAAEQFAAGELAVALEEPTGLAALSGAPPPARPRAAAKKQQATAPEETNRQGGDRERPARQEQRRKAQAALRETEQQLRDSRRAEQDAARAERQAQGALANAQTRLERARRELREAEREAESKGRNLSDRGRRREEAGQQVASAEQAVKNARQRLEELTS